MFVDKKHNHKKCVSRLKSRVSKVVSTDSLKLNENESRVIRVLAETHCAVGAYDIARNASDSEKNLQPVQIYRAVDRLIELGLVHKVNSEGGYVVCHAGETCTKPLFLICTSCHQVAETESNELDDAILRSAQSAGFHLQQKNIELLGLCPDCIINPPQH